MIERERPIVAGAIAAAILLLSPALLGQPVVLGQEPEPTIKYDRDLLPAPPSPSPSAIPETGLELVVALDGSEEFTTIGEAVDAATGGETVLVRAGTYEESVLVEKDITIRGDDRELVTVRSPASSPTCGPASTSGCALALVDSDATVTGLTLEADPTADGATALYVSGGAPFLDRPIVEGAVVFADGSTAYLWDGVVTGELLVSGAGTEPTIEGNEAFVVRVEDGAAPTIYRNEFSRLRMADSGGRVWANFIRGAGRRVAGADGIGVGVRRPLEGLVIAGNNINRHRIGLSVTQGTSLVIRSNNFENNRTGVRMDRVGDAEIRGNIFCITYQPFRVRSGPIPTDLIERCGSGG